MKLVEHNVERFVKTIKAGPKAEGRLQLLGDSSDECVRVRRILAAWPDDGGTRAILARTNAELLPAAAMAVEMGVPFKAPKLRLLSEDPRIDCLLGLVPAVADADGRDVPLLARLARLALGPELPADLAACAAPSGHSAGSGPRAGDIPEVPQRDEAEALLPIETADLLAALTAWAAPFGTLAELRVALGHHRSRLAGLRREDAPLTLATAHATKGLEYDHVAVIGLDSGRFPSARSLRDAAEPERTLEEERRLAYVAWTRARRSLTLVYDPASPSQFMLEAFSPAELGLDESPFRGPPVDGPATPGHCVAGGRSAATLSCSLGGECLEQPVQALQERLRQLGRE